MLVVIQKQLRQCKAYKATAVKNYFSICADSSTPYADCNDGEIRLVNSSSPLQGRVEICFNKAWGSVCDGLFGEAEAKVICHQLGFATEGKVPLHTYLSFLLTSTMYS